MNKEINNYLDKLFPNPKCELEYNKDYELLIAVMLSAQTTDKRVNMVTRVLFRRYDSLYKLSKANIKDIIDIIRPIGTFNKKASNIISISKSLINEQNGIVPNDRKYLESLSGVGRKTTNVFLGIIYNEPTIAVDTHVHRVSKRLGLTNINSTPEQCERDLLKLVPKDKQAKFHIQMVWFGRYYCKSINPQCENCKLNSICKRK